MSTNPAVKDFFSNKVTIQLKDGHKFEGLLSEINYKNQFVILIDVIDLGNQYDKDFIPHDKKIQEKVFQSENIDDILFQEKHFSEPKKYKKEDFWDQVSEPVPQKNERQGDYRGGEKKKYYEKRGGNDQRRGGNNRNYRDNRDYRQNRDNRQQRDNREYKEGNRTNNDRENRTGNYERVNRPNRDRRQQQDYSDDRQYR